MSTATATRPRPRWLTASTHLLGMHLWVAARFWAILALVLVAGHILMSGIIDERVRIARFSTYAAAGIPLALAAVVVLVLLAVHVTSGGTRRSFIRANLIVAALMGVAYGAVFFLFVFIEQAAFSAAPEPAGSPGPMLFTDSVWGALLGQALLSITAVLSGLLIGMGYYRTGALTGSLLLIPNLLPVAIVWALVSTGGTIQQWFGQQIPPAVAVPASLAVMAIAAVAFHLLSRRVAITPMEQS